ncbi:MAG: nucleotidyltransferase domain-containing protein [Candidatus Hodarchaeales archaeon]
MDEVQKKILFGIEKQIIKKINMKRGIRKKVKRFLERIQRKLLYKMVSISKVKQYNGNSSLGSDEFGRDVESGVLQYVELLKKRNLKIHTIIVLGSRVKGRGRSDSDVDLTIISSSSPKKGNNFISQRIYDFKIRKLYSDRPLYIGIEPSICLTKKEFLLRLEAFDVDALDAIYYGKIVYDDGFWELVKEKYQKIRKEYKINELLLKEKIYII